MKRVRCPREGTRVVFDANPAAMQFYQSGNREPRPGDRGTIRPVSLGSGKSTCMPGPGGGLVYVKWDDGFYAGVFRRHLRKESGGGLLGRAAKKKRR